MKISYQWLSEWVDLSEFKKPEDLADLLTARGLEVESVDAAAKGLEKVVVGQILEKVKHPEADRLSLCKVNIGKPEYLDIVCGAQNMKVGDFVAVAQVGALLPNGMKIEKGKIRGQISLGMLCSESELGFAKESEGIMILPDKPLVGWQLSDVLGLDDTVLEIKLTANRGDCLSHRGLAREIASAIGKKLKSPQVSNPFLTQSKIQVKALDEQGAAPQFFGVAINGVTVADSPAWLKKRLETIGQRSINNLVDIGNFLMFEYGFPVHVYDADKLSGNVLQVRTSKPGEKLKLLDGGEIETTGEELLIVDADKPVALAGVMGGANSEVTSSTKNVYLECAEFHPTLVRRAAFRFGRRSEASLRFEKGIDPEGHREAISRLADIVCKLAGGEVAGGSISQGASRVNATSRSISFDTAWLNEFLGTAIDKAQIVKLLENLDCKVTSSESEMIVSPPSYRLDLRIREDIAEEIARSIGYDAIPTTIPTLSGMPRSRKSDTRIHRLAVIDQIKNELAAMGLNEVLTYSFQSEAFLKTFGFKSSVKILNPLSEEQGFMVPSLLPGIFKAYQENERHHFGSDPLNVKLFEVRPVFSFAGEQIRADGDANTGVVERYHLSVLLGGEFDFYNLKAIVEGLFELLRTKGVRMRPADAALLQSRANLFHPGQTAQFAAGKESIGFAGALHPKLSTSEKCRVPIFWAELDLEPIFSLTPAKEVSFKPWSAFPTMERDFALLLDDTILAQDVIDSALKNGKPIAKVVKIFDTYKGAHIPEGKISLGVRVTFSDDQKSLLESQVEESSKLIVKKWEDEFKASLR